MIYAINYADEKFEMARKYNTETAYSKGNVDKVIEYSQSSLDSEFFKNNKTILSYKRGNGLWLWKPYIISKTLEQLNTGDYLIYTDSGSFYIRNVRDLINVLNRDHIDIMVFELPLLERQFTKRETFVLMDYNSYNSNQIMGSFIIVRKSKESVGFIKEWLKWMSDERIVSPNKFLKEINDFPDFYSHREDQSVLSILCHKHGIIPYRDPSQFGDRPWQYARKEWSYRPLKYENSPYKRVIISHRLTNPKPKEIIYKEIIRNFLMKLGIRYNRNNFFKIHNIPATNYIKAI